MPLNKKGKEIMSAMKQQYGATKGERVFYAAANKGTIAGVERNKGDYSAKARTGKRRRYYG